MVSDIVCVGVDCWDGSGSYLGRLDEWCLFGHLELESVRFRLVRLCSFNHTMEMVICL